MLAASYLRGIAGSSGVSGQQGIIITEDPNLKVGATLDMSNPIYVLSATPGGIAPAADLAAGGIYPAIAFVAISTTNCIFNPSIRGTALTVAA